MSGEGNGPRSGVFDPEEFGDLKARVKNVENEAIRARDDRAKLFQAVNTVANNQHVMTEKLDRLAETLNKFVTQCSSCRIDMGDIQREIDRLKNETSTDRIRCKSEPTPSVRAPKPWEKPVGDLMADILIGGVKVVGIAAVVYLLIQGVGNANL